MTSETPTLIALVFLAVMGLVATSVLHSTFIAVSLIIMMAAFTAQLFVRHKKWK